jgi:hypothetical protein
MMWKFNWINFIRRDSIREFGIIKTHINKDTFESYSLVFILWNLHFGFGLSKYA